MPESYLQIITKSYMKIVLNFAYSFLIGRTMSRKEMSYIGIAWNYVESNFILMLSWEVNTNLSLWLLILKRELI